MTYNDPRSVLVRIAKLQERLREKPKARFDFLKDSAKVLSVCAFVVSIITTIYSWRKDDVQTHQAARREFDSTMQQAVDVTLKIYEFQVKNKNQQNFGVINGWFNTQSALLQNKAIQDLAALDGASMLDYVTAGNIVAAGQPARAATLFKRAIEMGLQKKRERYQFLYNVVDKIESGLFGEKLDVSPSEEQRLYILASTYTSLGQVLLVQKMGGEAKEAYEAAIQLFNVSNLRIELKRYQIAIVYKFWADAEAVSLFDCNSSLAHLKKAAEYFPEWGKTQDNLDWSSIQFELSYATSYCRGDGRLHPPEWSASNSTAAPVPSATPDIGAPKIIPMR